MQSYVTFLLVLLVLLAGCAAKKEEKRGFDAPEMIIVTSSGFPEGGAIPPRFACSEPDIGGENKSPPLSLSGVPANASSLALIVEDPDAPGGTYTHWLAWNLSPSDTTIPEDADVASLGGREGTIGPGVVGYMGPCPPSGSHRYYYMAIALDDTLDLDAGAERGALDEAMGGKILAWGELMGRFTHA